MSSIHTKIKEFSLTQEVVTIEEAAQALSILSRLIHQRNVDAGWWSDPRTGERIERNMGEMLCLVHSEVSEAMEAHRKNLQDDKLPQYSGLVVELIDAMIREFDILGSEMARTDVDVTEVFLAKVNFNANRPDHKPENRIKEGGKAF